MYNRNKSLQKAQKFLQKNKFEQAIEVFEEIVQNDPSDVRTLLKIGDLQSKINAIESACTTYQKVAQFYARDGFYLKAVAVYKQILKLDPNLANVYLKLSELYQHLGLQSEAIKQYQTVVKLYESMGLIRESLDVLKKISDLEPDNVVSKIKLAEMYHREGHKTDAEAQLIELTQKLKSNANYSELIRVYDRMIAMGISSLDTELSVAESYLEQGDAKRALIQLQKLFQKDPRNIKILDVLARCFADLDQREKAKSVYTEIIGIVQEQGNQDLKDKYSAKLRALSVLAHPAHEVTLDLYEHSQSLNEDTVQSISDAPESDQSHAKVLEDAKIFLQYGLLAKAQEVLEGVIKEDGGTKTMRNLYSEVCGKLGQTEKIALLYNKLRNLKIFASEPYSSELKREMTELGLFSEATHDGKDDELVTIDTSSFDEMELIDDDPDAVVFETELAAETSQLDGDISMATDLSAEFDEDSSATFKNTTFTSEPIFEDQIQEPLSEQDSLGMTEDASSSFGEAWSMSTDGDEQSLASDFVYEESVNEINNSSGLVEVENPPPAQAPQSVAPKLSLDQMMGLARQALDGAQLEIARDFYLEILSQDRSHAPALMGLAELASRMQSKPPVAKPTAPTIPNTQLKAPTQPKPLEKPAPVSSTPPPNSELVEQSFFDPSSEFKLDLDDLGASFDEAAPSEEEVYLSPEEVISEFKKGVARTVASDDYQTHYDLGIAYKEMGLLDEAINEFLLAQKEPDLQAECASMLGMTYIQKRDVVQAINTFKNALSTMTPASKGYLGLMYELAESLLELGRVQDALQCYQRVYDLDASFRSVRKKLKEIESLESSHQPKVLENAKPAEIDFHSQASHVNANLTTPRTLKRSVDVEEEKESLEIQKKRNKVSFV